MKGLTDDLSTSFDNSEASTHVPTVNAVKQEFENYAPLEHRHLIDDIYTINESTNEEEDLSELLDGKSDVGHTHEISDVTGLQTALDGKSDVNHTHPDYLTSEMIHEDSELQELLKGDKGDKGDDGADGADGLSAFEVWKEQQPAKQEGEPDYTYNDYITAITGPRGPKGDAGDPGTDGDGNSWLDTVVGLGKTFSYVMQGAYYGTQAADVIMSWRNGVFGASRSARGLNSAISAMTFVPLVAP